VLIFLPPAGEHSRRGMSSAPCLPGASASGLLRTNAPTSSPLPDMSQYERKTL
jgi:hypothetical protein